MNTNTSTQLQKRLEKTVLSLCSIIKRKVDESNKADWTEYLLRRELVACILGSQVRFEMAEKALERIEHAELLNDKWWKGSQEEFEPVMLEVLLGQKSKSKNKWCYRFPKLRASQLAKTRDSIAKTPLLKRLSQHTDPKILRKQFVNDFAGLGPKQASMFLRNTGMSYDLAVLDTHVLRFMNGKDFISLNAKHISTVRAYEQAEKIVLNYADNIGYPVGYIDWAIWATMRAAKELNL